MISASAPFNAANAVLAQRPIHILTIAGYDHVFVNRATGIAGQYDWIEVMSDWSTTVSELDGGTNLGEFDIVVQDRGHAITAAFPSFVFEGKVATIKTGFFGMDQADFVTIFTGVVDRVESVNSNNSYQFALVDNKSILDKVIYETGDDGFGTSSEHRKTLNAHPIDLLIDVLENQLGIAAGNINLTKLTTYRDGIFSGTQFVFNLESPPVAREFIERQLLKPLGGYIWTNNLGQLDVNFIYPLTTAPVFTINEDIFAAIPEALQHDLINTINVRLDKDPDSGNFLSEVVEQYGVSVARFGQYGQSVIESEGMRSALQGFFLAAITARMIFQKYGLKNLKFDTAELTWKACILELGDIVQCTHSKVPDRATGTFGITNKVFVVLDRTLHFASGTVSLLLAEASYLANFGQFKIAADGLADYPSASAPNKAAYMFLCNDSDQYSTGAAAHTLG